jgi:hypothetical protein
MTSSSNQKQQKLKRGDIPFALIVATAAGLLAAKLYFLWAWPW